MMRQTQEATAEFQHLLRVPPTDFVGDRNNAAAVAHAALQSVRDTGDPRFLFLRSILELRNETQSHEELLFHCLTGCRQVILQKWTYFAKGFRDHTRDFFMALGLQQQVPRTTRLACFTTSASFWKRQWTDEEGENRPLHQEEQALVDGMLQSNPTILDTKESLFRYLESLLQPNSPHISLGSTYMSVLVGEFMGKSAVQYNLPLEFHKKAHAFFERRGWLDHCLRLAMGALSHVVSIITRETPALEALALPVVQLTIDVIGWEFGADAWDAGIPSSKTLIRPPTAWGDYLTRPDFCGAIFHMYGVVRNNHSALAQNLRQLLLFLASLSGPIFADDTHRKNFARYLVEGSLQLLSSTETREQSELLDALSIVGRLIANFSLSTLVSMPSLSPLLSTLTTTGTGLLQGNVQECISVGGDIERMEHREFRDEALGLLLDAVVLLCADPWLLYSGNEESRETAREALASALGPLYDAFVASRIQMAKLEEVYLTTNAEELDEVREEISAVDLEEELTSVAMVGRLRTQTSLACLSELFQPILPRLQSLWGTLGEVTPEQAALLEETRLLARCIGHLLTDDNEGETPVIPESLIMSCQAHQETSRTIASAVDSVLSLAQLQATKLGENAADPSLSPLLATSFLWFLNRWAPSYILPLNYCSIPDKPTSPILTVWGDGDAPQHAISFCTTLCLHYQCFWPQERHVQESSSKLIMSLAKRDKIRPLLVASPSFQQMASFHCLTAGLHHSSTASELESTLQAKAPGASAIMASGYQRLPYEERSRILTALLVGACDRNDQATQAIFRECLGSVQEAFSLLVKALKSKQVSADDVKAKEMACLCVEMYGGIARASEATDPERLVQFITPALPELSGLMAYYAGDLSVCEGLLRLFRDYTEQFVVILDRDQSLALFSSSAELLKSYSSHHCASRVIRKAAPSSTQAGLEEEQEFSDILSAIQLLIHLGTKDFIDVCSSTNDGVDSNQVTDVIFFGLQQIIPLMTQGLLQFPTLCTHYFSLVGFMMDTYPDKVCTLPYELFDSLLESLLFGMSHMDTVVGKSCLQGIAGLAKEHMKTDCLAGHLSLHPDIFDKCSRRILHEVVFQGVVWDRLEAAGMALLPVAAVDLGRFANVVDMLSQQVPQEHQARLQASFQKLMQTDVLAKVASGGYEGRMNRLRFKKDFEVFVKDIHSFLIVK